MIIENENVMECIKINKSQIIEVLHARGITSVMEILYAKFIRIQNRLDLHCQISEPFKSKSGAHWPWILARLGASLSVTQTKS